MPLWSLSLLAFVPFLQLASVRRRSRDWLVFWCYLAADVVVVVLRFAGSMALAAGWALLVMVVATVHAFIEFSPGRGLPAPARQQVTAGPSPPAGATLPSPDGAPCADVAGELAHLRYVEQFLNTALTDRAISVAVHRLLAGRVAARQAWLAAASAAAMGGAPAPAAPARATPAAPGTLPRPGGPMARPPGAPTGVVPPPVTPGPAPPSVPARIPVRKPSAPGPGRRWLRTARETIRSGLAVHGLAYLGVLLLFAGLFGLVAFSFASVGVGLRPVAEVAVPSAVLGSAWLLARRGLATPARALTLLGGLLVPVGALAAFADDAPVPPDPAGIPLVVALTAASAAVAAAYAGWWHWHPATPLRHLIAPVLWLMVAMAALGFSDPIPSGQDIVTPRPGQFAAVLTAMMLTLAVARTRIGRPLLGVLFPAVLAGLGIAVLLEGLAAGAAGWPAVPVAVSGAAAIIALELAGREVPVTVRVAAEGVIAGLTGLALAPALGVGWAGAAAAITGIAVAERALERSGPGLALARGTPGLALLAPLAVAVAGIVCTAGTPWALLTASAAASCWAQARRLWPGRWPYPAGLLAAAAAIAPAGVLAGLLGALPGGMGAAIAGLLMLAAAVAVRVTGRPADRFWSWWMPVAAGLVLVTPAGQGAAAGFVIAAVSATAVIVVAPAPPVVRVWLAGAAVLWTAWLVFEAAAVPTPVRLVAIAGAALAAIAVAAWWPGVPGAHAGLFGHLVAVTCWPLAALDAGAVDAATPVAVIGLAAAGAVVTTVAQEAGHAGVPDLLVRCAKPVMRGPAAVAALRQVPAVAAAVLLAAFTASVLALAGFGVQRPWWPAAMTALGAGYVLLGRALQARPRVARVATDIGWLGLVLAAAACRYRGPALVALAAVMVTPAFAAPVLRRRLTVWVAWAASVPAAVLAAGLAGLPSRFWYTVMLGWGALLLLGGLTADGARAGWRRPGPRVQTGSLVPPVTVGATAVAAAVAVAGALASSGRGSPREFGWTLIAAAVVVAAAGALLRLGVLGGAGAAMAAGGSAAVSPGMLWDRPWLLLAAAAVLLAAAQVAAIWAGQGRPWWQRWDLPLFVVAHLTALASLVLAAVSGVAAAQTTAACGALGVAIAWRLRRWLWAAGGAALILAGAAWAGPGWACLAFAGVSAVATTLAVGRDGRTRLLLQVTGALAAVGAAVAGLAWQAVPASTATGMATLAAGAVVLLAGAAARLGLPRDWVRVWGGAMLAVTAAAAAALGLPGVPASEGWLAAAGLAAAAAGCGLAAAPLRLGLLRECAAALTVAAGLVLAYAGQAGLTVLAWGAAVTGLAAGGMVLAPWLRPAAPAWVRPALGVSIAATGVALGAGVAAWPDRTLLVPAFVLVAVVIVELTVSLHRPAMVAATPLPLCAAWLAYASEALTGQPQWFTVPVGAALLGISALLRSVRRAGGLPVAGPDVVALEIAGMALIMGASLVQCVTRGPVYGLIGAGLGLALICWGALTRVRRRLAGGTAAFLVSLLLAIAVPLVPLVPRGGGAVVWLTLAGAGLLAIAVAAMLDATRGAVRRGVARLRDLTRDWE